MIDQNAARRAARETRYGIPSGAWMHMTEADEAWIEKIVADALAQAREATATEIVEFIEGLPLFLPPPGGPIAAALSDEMRLTILEIAKTLRSRYRLAARAASPPEVTR